MVNTILFTASVDPFQDNCILFQPVPTNHGALQLLGGENLAFLLRTDADQGTLFIKVLKGQQKVIEALMKEDFRFIHQSSLLDQLAVAPGTAIIPIELSLPIAASQEDDLQGSLDLGGHWLLIVHSHRLLPKDAEDAPAWLQGGGGTNYWQVHLELAERISIGGL